MLGGRMEQSQRSQGVGSVSKRLLQTGISPTIISTKGLGGTGPV
jgi:hypothetical protein